VVQLSEAPEVDALEAPRLTGRLRWSGRALGGQPTSVTTRRADILIGRRPPAGWTFTNTAVIHVW
jgi:hypothetical protein